MDVNKLIDEFIVPAAREGRIVHTNGGQWVLLEGDSVRTIDITGQMEANSLRTAESYARAWGLSMPLQTRPAEPNFSNWLK